MFSSRRKCFQNAGHISTALKNAATHEHKMLFRIQNNLCNKVINYSQGAESVKYSEPHSIDLKSIFGCDIPGQMHLWRLTRELT